MSLRPASKKKLQLYVAATWLFNSGWSYPQVIDELTRFEPDIALLTKIVNSALKEKWEQLSADAQTMFAQGLPRDIVIETLLKEEPDQEIAIRLCDNWYMLKLQYMECLNEGPVNVFDGLVRISIGALGLLVMFLIHSFWLTKVIWIVFIILSITQFATGLLQNNIAGRLNRMLAD